MGKPVATGYTTALEMKSRRSIEDCVMMNHVLRSLCLLAIVAVPMRAAADDKDLAGKQQKKQFEREVTVKITMKYLLFLPESYTKNDQTWPLMLFLHGAGESGSDLNLVKKHGPPKIVETKKDFPFIVVSPQSARGGWDAAALN